MLNVEPVLCQIRHESQRKLGHTQSNIWNDTYTALHISANTLVVSGSMILALLYTLGARTVKREGNR